MCENDHVCYHAPSQGSEAERRWAITTSQCRYGAVWLLTFPVSSHSTLPPSSLCSGRASHLEQQAAGGDDIICTAAHCSTGSEQRHVSPLLTIPTFPLHCFVCTSQHMTAERKGSMFSCIKAGSWAVTNFSSLAYALSLE